MSETKLIVLAKAPLLGFSKTRLIPDLGEQSAQQLAEKLFKETIELLKQLSTVDIELCVKPTYKHHCWKKFDIPKWIEMTDQTDGNLGDKQYYVANKALKNYSQVIIMGTDCPQITVSLIDSVIEKLLDYDACVVPANDGGYVLLAIKQMSDDLFSNIVWSTGSVNHQLINNMKKNHWSVYEFPSLIDIDNVDDLLSINSSYNNI